MRSIKPIVLVFFTAAILPLLVSCVPESCFEEMTSNVIAPLYTSSNKANKAPSSLSLYGLGSADSMIYNNSKSIKIAEIPLDPSADSCSFIIGINSGTDTLTFRYTTFIHLVSKECGYTYFHNIDTLVFTKNAIDTLIILNRYVTTSDETNIQIYY